MTSSFERLVSNLTATSMLVTTAFIAAACSQEQAATEQAAAEQAGASPVEVTMSEIMTGVMTPATNAIWNGSYSPDLSEEDWQRLLEASIQVSVAVTAISLGGTDDVAGGRADMDNWQEWSAQLGELALMAKTAAENRDQMAFANAGDPMVDICEACHIAYLPGAQ